MSVRSTVASAILGEARTLRREDVPSVMLSSTPSGRAVTPRGSLEIADAYACVRAMAEAAGSLPLIPYRKTPQGRARIERGIGPELLSEPAPGVTQPSFIGQLVVHLNTHGNAYVGKYKEGGRLVQLGLMNPDRMKVELKRGKPAFEYVGPKGQRIPNLTTDDVIHVKMLTTDGLLGMSPVRQARVVLGHSEQLDEHASVFFANDAMPSGVLKLQKYDADDEDIKSLRDGFNAEHQGVANAHKIAVLKGEVDFVPFSMPLGDAQFLEQHKLSSVQTARIFRVPPWMIGADSGESMTYSNVEQQDLQFLKYGLGFTLRSIEQAFSADQDLMGRTEYAEFLLDALLRSDAKTRAEVYRMALDPITGWMNRDEVRERENLKAEPERPDVPPLPQPEPRPDPALNGNGNGS